MQEQNKEAIKEALLELIKESPDLFSPILHDILLDNTRLKKRVSILEGHLGLSEDSYLDLLEEDITPFCDHVKQLQERATKTETEEQIDILRQELIKKFVLRTKDVMAIFGFRHYEQARRLMKKTAEKYPDIVFENDNSKGHRLRIGKASLNNVRTRWDVNNVCAQN